MLEKFMLLKHVYKTLRRNENLVIITDTAIKTRGDYHKNTVNVSGALDLLRVIRTKKA